MEQINRDVKWPYKVIRGSDCDVNEVYFKSLVTWFYCWPDDNSLKCTLILIMHRASLNYQFYKRRVFISDCYSRNIHATTIELISLLHFGPWRNHCKLNSRMRYCLRTGWTWLWVHRDCMSSLTRIEITSKHRVCSTECTGNLWPLTVWTFCWVHDFD